MSPAYFRIECPGFGAASFCATDANCQMSACDLMPVAAPNSAAASAAMILDFSDSGVCIDPEVSISTRFRPGKAGMFDSDAATAFSSAACHISEFTDLYAE